LAQWFGKGHLQMGELNFTNPVFATYVVAATVMILKAVAMSWLTVFRMIRANGGFRSPEDNKKTLANPHPHAEQLAPNPAVERVRRIQLNDLESLPYFLVAGLLWVLTQPSPLLAQWLFYGYVVTRLLHFAAYLSGQIHDLRALLWTPGSLIIIFISCSTLAQALHSAF
jgi:glutathione S-transferase